MNQQIIDGIYWIQGQDGFLPDSHMYVIGKADREDYTLVDCGLMDKGEYKLNELDKIGVSPNHVKRIVMTHTHLDHIGCLPEILKAIPHAEIWMHADEARPLEQGDSRIVFGNRMFEQMLKLQYNLPKGYFQVTVHRKLEDNEIIDLGGVPFKVIHIPGHSCGGIGLFNESERLFLSGDTIYADGAIGRYDLESADPAQLRASLDRIAGLGVDILLPCHNRIVIGGAEPMVSETVKQWGPMLAS